MIVKTILVTGAAGFIGSRCGELLAERGHRVVGIDNINDYYDVALKYARLRRMGFDVADGGIAMGARVESATLPSLSFERIDVSDKAAIDALFARHRFDRIIHLAAQAGVRYSIENPYAYMESNMLGFLNILEACRHYGTEHLVFASSSSVYGLNEKAPFEEDDVVISPVSLYAASKKSNELMAHAYCKLYGIPSTGLRYFTVYGPYGRPDMAPMLFAQAISRGNPIRVFNNGDMHRDFTYIDDIVNGTLAVLDHVPDPRLDPHGLPHRIYNIGCGHSVPLMDFIAELERNLGREATKQFLPMQPGDVSLTYASTARLEREIGYKPVVELPEGMREFVRWFQSDANPLRP